MYAVVVALVSILLTAIRTKRKHQDEHGMSSYSENFNELNHVKNNADYDSLRNDTLDILDMKDDVDFSLLDASGIGHVDVITPPATPILSADNGARVTNDHNATLTVNGSVSDAQNATGKRGKRRKPVKWETWEEKNLIEGVRRFGRGNWSRIRAEFEFQFCRTNVDLHDKWRVLTGERKRSKAAKAAAANTGGSAVNALAALGDGKEQAELLLQQSQDIQGSNPEGRKDDLLEVSEENKITTTPFNGIPLSPTDLGSNTQKVQLIPVAGTNGLYTLSSFVPRNIQMPDGMDKSGQQNDLIPGDGTLHTITNGGLLDAAVFADSGAISHMLLSAAAISVDQSLDESSFQPKKRVKKTYSKVVEPTGDEDEVALELLKLFNEPVHQIKQKQPVQKKKKGTKKGSEESTNDASGAENSQNEQNY